jgi:hypothetical protein
MNDKNRKAMYAKKFNTLPNNVKKNYMSTAMGIRPEHIDTGDFKYSMFDKWQKKSINDMIDMRKS